MMTGRCYRYLTVSTLCLFAAGCSARQSPLGLLTHRAPEANGTATQASHTVGPATADAVPLHVTGARSSVDRVADNQFDVRCDHVDAVAVQQREPTWCWAACAQMLAAYHGLAWDQGQVVDRIKRRASKGGVDDQSANQVEIWVAMNPELLDEYDRRAASWDRPGSNGVSAHVHATLDNLLSMARTPSQDVIVEELSAGNPVLVGLTGDEWGTGHIVLAYGARYSCVDPAHEPEYHYVGVGAAGPAPGGSHAVSVIDLLNAFQPFSEQPRSYKVASLSIVDPQPDYGKSQLGTLDEREIRDHLDFFLGKTEATGKLRAFMLTVLPTPAEMAQAMRLDNQIQRSVQQAKRTVGGGGNGPKPRPRPKQTPLPPPKRNAANPKP